MVALKLVGKFSKMIKILRRNLVLDNIANSPFLLTKPKKFLG